MNTNSLSLTDERYAEILTVLAEDGGFTTGQVAKKIKQFGSNAHQHSGAVRSWLNTLRAMECVDHLDDKKPVCWVRTRNGTAWLKRKGVLS